MAKIFIYSLKKLFALFVLIVMIWTGQNGTFASQGCGSAVNNSIKSPGYPNNYPSDMYCVYTIPIPQGMAFNISFLDFHLEDDYGFCNYDFLKITDGNSYTFGVYCGEKAGENIVVTGDHVVITFYSDDIEQRKGFWIIFTPVPVVHPKVTLSSPVVRTLRGFRQTLCSSTGTPPVFTALIRNFTVLTNTTKNVVTINLHEEGNYTCVATGAHEADVREFSVIFNDCGFQCSSGWTFYDPNFLHCSNITSFDHVIKCAPTVTRWMNISSSNFSRLPFTALSKFSKLKHLNLTSNGISFSPGDKFPILPTLEDLYLSSNAITFLPNEIFANLKSLRLLLLPQNRIKFLSERVFAGLRRVISLYLQLNEIQFLPVDVFADMTELHTLNLSHNALKSLPYGILAKQAELFYILDLSANNLQSFPDGVLDNMTYLFILELTSIGITVLPDGVFSSLTNLQILELNSNAIEFLPDGIFATSKKLEVLDLSFNNIQHLQNDVFSPLFDLTFLFLNNNQIRTISNGTFTNNIILKELLLSDNPIEKIEPEAFRLGWNTLRIYLLRTKLKRLSLESFLGLYGLDFQINPVYSKNEAIEVTWREIAYLLAPLEAAGFRGIQHQGSYFDHSFEFLPCPLGTFSNLTSKGAEECIQCPPGGFYSDDVAYVSESCKKCPNGSFVAFDKAPGTRSQDCKACPQGTETDFFAGYRACQCLKEFYRTDMFDKCYKCGQGGLQCKDDYASLKPGYWWEWRNKTHKKRYEYFIANMLASSPALDAFSVKYPYAIPTPYKCPVEESCKGGLESPCGTGYQGPLCAVCSPGYYKQLQTCTKCPSKKWIVTQLSIIAAVLLIIIGVLVWTNKRKETKDQETSLIDKFFSKLKIVIGFYQVTYGLLEVFSYITWPDSLQVIAKYSGVLQLNILQIAPIQCLFIGLQVDAFGNLFAMMAINGTVIVLSGIYYLANKAVIWKDRHLGEEERSRKVSEAKDLVYRNLFFFLYVTYLSTCSKTAVVLPLACQKICRDENEEFCFKYLKADYSTQCQGSKYHYFLIGAYISTAYIIVLPVASFITLWRHARAAFSTRDAKKFQQPLSRMEMITGLGFLFENYKPRSWYWELVEMSRKVVLTSALILVGQESRSYIGLTLAIAGMYGIVFSWMRPMQDAFENRLMVTSLAVTVANLAVGAVSRIPAENIADSGETYTEAVLFQILVIGANTMVVSLLVVEYAVILYGYLKEWRKNPQCSFFCCLASLLPLNSFKGKTRGSVEITVENQLETGQADASTAIHTIKDDGTVNFTPKEGESKDGGEMFDLKKKYRGDDKCNSKTFFKHVQTQTEPTKRS